MVAQVDNAAHLLQCPSHCGREGVIGRRDLEVSGVVQGGSGFSRVIFSSSYLSSSAVLFLPMYIRGGGVGTGSGV